MSRVLLMCLMLLSVSAIAQERPEYGLSNSVIVAEKTPEVREKLDRQAKSGAPEESELSVQAYVDSQERIAETFRRAIPDKMAEASRGEE
ncbi:hypothetical protein ACQUWM_14115 [Marinobacter sp. DUT-3]|uniref:hypothetical protein n=1 Tax=unclassified Marinobacter TaxID=83889 RepID=UPI00387B37D2